MQGLPKRKLRFGEYLFYSGKINWQTFMDALVYQCQVRPMIGQPFGKYFIDKGIMSASELQKNLTNFHYHNMFVSGTP